MPDWSPNSMMMYFTPSLPSFSAQSGRSHRLVGAIPHFSTSRWSYLRVGALAAADWGDSRSYISSITEV